MATSWEGQAGVQTETPPYRNAPPAASGGGAAGSSDGTNSSSRTHRSSIPALAGHPKETFHYRCNLRQAELGSLADGLILVLCAIGLGRCRNIMFPAGGAWRVPMFAWQLAVVLGCAANIAWRTCHRTSYVQRREALVTLLRCIGTGLGLGGVLMRRLMDDMPLPPADADLACNSLAVAAHLLKLLFISGSVHLLLFFLAWRVRLSLSVAAQLAMLLSVIGCNPGTCSTAMLSHPAVQRSTHKAYQLLSLAGYPLPLPLALFVRPDSHTECVAILNWLQVAAGFLLPLLWEAVTAARLFQQHQQQRRQLRLPPERGPHAWFYDAVWAATHDDGGSLRLVILLWMLLAVSWDWMAFFSVPPAQRHWD